MTSLPSPVGNVVAAVVLEDDAVHALVVADMADLYVLVAARLADLEREEGVEDFLAVVALHRFLLRSLAPAQQSLARGPHTLPRLTSST